MKVVWRLLYLAASQSAPKKMAETRGVEPLQPFGRHPSKVLQYHYATFPCGRGCQIRTDGTFRSSWVRARCNKPLYQPSMFTSFTSSLIGWRKVKDLNLRRLLPLAWLATKCDKPLCQPSVRLCSLKTLSILLIVVLTLWTNYTRVPTVPTVPITATRAFPLSSGATTFTTVWIAVVFEECHMFLVCSVGSPGWVRSTSLSIIG